MLLFPSMFMCSIQNCSWIRPKISSEINPTEKSIQRLKNLGRNLQMTYHGTPKVFRQSHNKSTQDFSERFVQMFSKRYLHEIPLRITLELSNTYRYVIRDSYRSSSGNSYEKIFYETFNNYSTEPFKHILRQYSRKATSTYSFYLFINISSFFF